MITIKKILFYVFIVISIMAAAWAYYRLKENKEPKTAILEHIPANAFCVIETKNIQDLITQLTRQNLIWNSLSSQKAISDTQKGIIYLDSLVKSNTELTDIINNNKIYWSFVKDGKTFQSIIQFKVKETDNEAVFADFFSRTFKKETSVSSFEVYQFILNDEKWLATYKDGIVYLTSDLSLLETCINLNKKESISNNLAYVSLLDENGSQSSGVYVNQEALNLFDSYLFTKQAYFNVKITLNEITLNGYTLLDSLSFFNTLKNQEPVTIRGFEMLPNNPTSFCAISVSDTKLFYTQLLRQSKTEQQNQLTWKQLNEIALYNIQDEMLENIDHEILLAHYVTENGNSSTVSIEIKDEDKANGFMNLISDSVFTLQTLKVYKLQSRFSNLVSILGNSLGNEYACLNQGRLIFLSDRQMLSQYAEAISTTNLLGKNGTFMNYAHNHLLQACNYVYYENVESTLKHNLKSRITSTELIMPGNAISYQSLTAKNFKNNMQVRMNALHLQERQNLDSLNHTGKLWSFKSDSSVISPVYLFTNHLTQENELCFQDKINHLYLINSMGNLLWKKKLLETVQSKIYTVDIFKNGKLQLLFNTQNYLHLIDRNGNYVQGFPVKLPAKVTSNMTLVDYDNHKDYRLFIACADKNIYNYSLYGIKTEGFVPVKTDALVSLPIYYIKVGLSDYLVTADTAGKIYAFSRKGEGRIDFKNKTVKQPVNLQVIAGNTIENTKLAYIDTKNNVLNRISLSDKKETIKIGDDLKGLDYKFEDTNADKQPDMLLFGDGAIYIYDLFSNKLAESFNRQAVYADVQVAVTSTHKWIVAYDKSGSKIDIIDKSGKIVTSITNVSQKPLVSNLYKNGKTYILVTGKNRLSCEELN